MTKKKPYKLQIPKTIIICVLLFIMSFYLGFNWNTGRFHLFGVPSDIFTCLSYNNLQEAYQMNCFLPVDKTPFVLDDKLECIAYTNQQSSSGIWRINDPVRNSITFHKSEYVKIFLTFQDNNIVRTSNTGDDPVRFEIINNNSDSIQAFHSGTDGDNSDPDYFLTLSKNYGNGMEVWHNKEWYGDASIASFFFQCE